MIKTCKNPICGHDWEVHNDDDGGCASCPCKKFEAEAEKAQLRYSKGVAQKGCGKLLMTSRQERDDAVLCGDKDWQTEEIQLCDSCSGNHSPQDVVNPSNSQRGHLEGNHTRQDSMRGRDKEKLQPCSAMPVEKEPDASVDQNTIEISGSDFDLSEKINPLQLFDELILYLKVEDVKTFIRKLNEVVNSHQLPEKTPWFEAYNNILRGILYEIDELAGEKLR